MNCLLFGNIFNSPIQELLLLQDYLNYFLKTWYCFFFHIFRFGGKKLSTYRFILVYIGKLRIGIGCPLRYYSNDVVINGSALSRGWGEYTSLICLQSLCGDRTLFEVEWDYTAWILGLYHLSNDTNTVFFSSKLTEGFGWS